MEQVFQICDGFDLRLIEERQRLGLSRDALADQLEISRGTMWRLESSRSSASVELLTAMQKLNIDVQFLLTGMRTERLARIDDDESWGRAAQAVTKAMNHHGLTPSPSTYWRLVRLLHQEAINETNLKKDVTAAIEMAGRLFARPD